MMRTALDEACEDARQYHYLWKAAEAREARLLARCAAVEALLAAARALLDCEWTDNVPLLELVVLNDALGGERFPWDTPAWRAEHGLADATRPGAGDPQEAR